MYVLTCADCGFRLCERKLPAADPIDPLRDVQIRMLHHLCTPRLARERDERRARRRADPSILRLPEGADPIAHAHALFPSLDFDLAGWDKALADPVAIDEWGRRANSIEARIPGRLGRAEARQRRRNRQSAPLRGIRRWPRYQIRAGRYLKVGQNGAMASSELYPDCPHCKDRGPHRIRHTAPDRECWSCGACAEEFEIEIAAG